MVYHPVFVLNICILCTSILLSMHQEYFLYKNFDGTMNSAAARGTVVIHIERFNSVRALSALLVMLYLKNIMVDLRPRTSLEEALDVIFKWYSCFAPCWILWRPGDANLIVYIMMIIFMTDQLIIQMHFIYNKKYAIQPTVIVIHNYN